MSCDAVESGSLMKIASNQSDAGTIEKEDEGEIE